jgi:hypothetical protein
MLTPDNGIPVSVSLITPEISVFRFALSEATGAFIV